MRDSLVSFEPAPASGTEATTGNADGELTRLTLLATQLAAFIDAEQRKNALLQVRWANAEIAYLLGCGDTRDHEGGPCEIR
jgi:hypothetical protein